ncbi:MNP1 (YGL068W) [Zygosaccharomyces parabailii]|nr:MNP1 (YGL068W) [Zygosaccharomyces parabailii]CDH17953.1 related to 54S ribosomal protein L12,mitochondrial [Zygosaccharomyces bailii ISA1307]
MLRLVARRSAVATPSILRVTPIFACRCNSTEAAQQGSQPVDPKIANIVNEISKLTLLETSTLINELKTQLKIPDIALPAAGAAAAPVAGAAPPAEDAAQEEKPEEKTIFAVKLESFDAKSKPKIIKEIKGMLGLSLVEAKKFAEAAPKVLKDNVAKDDAEKIKSTLEGLGAKVSLE